MALLVALHVLAAVVWVGGMFFTYTVLRQSVAPLEPQARLAIWHRIFGRFFPWVWVTVLSEVSHRDAEDWIIARWLEEKDECGKS